MNSADVQRVVSSLRYVSLDLELNQPSRRIIQVGVAIGSADVPESAWDVCQWLVDPGEPISPEIVTLTGITDEAIRESGVGLAEVSSELSLLLERPHFVNPVTWGGGDMGALKDAFENEGVPFRHFGRRWLDVKTLHVAGKLAVGGNAAGGLKSAMGQHGLTFQGLAHRADVDAFNTLRLFFKIQERQRKLTEMVAMCKAL